MLRKGKHSFIVAALLLAVNLSVHVTAQVNTASFKSFEYKGMDARFNQKINSKTEYFNPILCGFYPDPSICRKGDNYYLVNSSFAFYPGIPVFHSKDLVNWTQIGYVLNRPSQLNLDRIRISGGIYAPAITYNKHNNTFYLITTCVDGIGNFVVKTKDPAKGWSDPILLSEVEGIDPSFFFDEDGKGYIVHNDIPQGAPQWDGHRAIWIHNYDVATDRTYGEKKVLIDGGSDRGTKPVWIEGPHLYKVNGYYYLMAAEGGTGENHSEVIFRSTNVKGPYISYKENPILTQRDLPASRLNKITSTGHADLIDTPDGKWYAVFLGCRPYKSDLYNTGRETFLLPVTWKDEYPVILEKGKAIPVISKKDGVHPAKNTLSGNFTWKDEFTTNTLNLRWNFIRTPREEWWKIANGELTLDALPLSIYEINNPAFIGCRQQHIEFEVQCEMSFASHREKELAGIALYQNEKYNIVFGKSSKQGKNIILIEQSAGKTQKIAEYFIPKLYKDVPVRFKIKGNNDKCCFHVSFDKGKQWIRIAENIDVTNLSTSRAGGFVGTYIGMYATSSAN